MSCPSVKTNGRAATHFSGWCAVLTLAFPLAAHAADPLAPWVRQVEAFDAAGIRPHPRLLLTPPETSRVRGAANAGDGKPYLAAVRKHADAQREKSVPAEPAGFKDGKWNIEDWRRIVDAGGAAQNNILASSFLWALSQDPRDLVEAKRWALGIAAWNPNGPTGIEGVDHPAHDILHALALSYDWLYSEWTPAERKVLQTCIAKRGRALYKDLKPYTQDSWNNHPWFRTTALVEAGLALAGDDVPPDVAREADTWWRYGSNLYFTEFLPLGGRDGDWHEGIHYVSYTLIFVYQWADALRSATGINAYDVPWLKEIGWFRVYTQPPAGGGIKFNDNNFLPPNLWDKMTAHNAARYTGDPTLQWYAENMRVASIGSPIAALYALIYRDPALPSTPPDKDLPLGKWYRDSGWAVLRTDLSSAEDVQFGLKAGPHLAGKGGKGHDHPDQNGFLLNFMNEELAVDSGYYDYYGSPHHTNWTFTPQAHNTLLVNGKGQLIAPEKASYVTSFTTSAGGLDVLESEAAPAYPKGLLKSWRRQVVFVRPDIFLIRDVVRPEKPATLDWLLHGPNQFEVSGQALLVRNDKAALAVNIAAPRGLKISQWVGFPKNAQPERKKPGQFPDQWHLTAQTPAPVGDTVFLTALRPGLAGQVSSPEVRRSIRPGVEFVTLPDAVKGDTRVAFFSAPGRHGVWGFDTDARIVANHEGTGEFAPSTAVAFTAASSVDYGGHPIFRSTVPADVSGGFGENGWIPSGLTVNMHAAGRVWLGTDWKPSAALVDGKEAPSAWDSASATMALDLNEGPHTIAFAVEDAG